MQEPAPKLSIKQCREITRIRRDQIHDLVTNPKGDKETYNQISDTFTQIVLAFAEHIDDEEITRNIDALVKAYDSLALRLGIRPYISEVEDAEEGEPELPVDEP